ncbi:MAG: hypothetical protein AAGA48_13520 [Myxococcota bacterium]
MQHWAWGIAALAIPVTVGSMCSQGDEPLQNNVQFANYHWAQRAPRSARDMVRWFSVVKRRDARFGASQVRSAFRWVGESFRWRRDGNKVTLSFPQSNNKVTVVVKTYRCKKGIFDRCLDLTRNGQTVTLYSREDLRIRDDGSALAPFAPTDLSSNASPDDDCATCSEDMPEALRALFEEAPALEDGSAR